MYTVPAFLRPSFFRLAFRHPVLLRPAFLVCAPALLLACSGEAGTEGEPDGDPGSGGEWGDGDASGGLGNGTGSTGSGGVPSGVGGALQGTGGVLGGTGGALPTGGTLGAGGGADSSGGTLGSGGEGLGTGGLGTGGAGTGGSGTGGSGTGGSGSGGSASANCEGGAKAGGFYVSGGRLYDTNCNEFIMRGVNDPYTWFQSNAEGRYADIASLGSNAVRVVLSTGGQWARVGGSTLSSIISWLKANQLVGVLEVHDSTGFGESAAAVHPDDAVDYWLSSDIRSAIDGQEEYVLINIANEPFGNTETAQWQTFHAGAVASLRTAGVGHTLIVDAPNWGQDWTNTMRDGAGAEAIFNADPDRNVVFSVHMYDVYGTGATVQAYFDNFLEKGLPLLVGEFAADHGAGNEVDEGTIMAQAVSRGVGYLGWSWSGNGGNLGSLDITNNFNADSLTTWGTRLIQGNDGIVSTSETCTCFD